MGVEVIQKGWQIWSIIVDFFLIHIFIIKHVLFDFINEYI